jgi:hypothetical protein
VTASLPDPTAENRLIYHVPPQEGKSEQVSRRFPAYARKLSLGAQMI